MKINFTPNQLFMLFLFFIFSVFFRFYLLDQTATFFWDQAHDLTQIKSFYAEKRITLIGPISEGGDKVFGSLSYYLLLPFAVIGNFSTISTTYGAAFFGLVTAVLLILLNYSLNKNSLIASALIVSLWFPLIETSRWAWNPHFTMMWIALGLLALQKKTPLTIFFSGFFFGVSIHHHYLSLIATFSFIFFYLLTQLRDKQRQYLLLLVGYFLAISPFILFDLTHPPGLFVTRFLLFSEDHLSLNLVSLLFNFKENLILVLNHYTHSNLLSVILLFYLIFLIKIDLKKYKKYIIFIIVWLLQIIVVSVLPNVYTHYFLPGLVFFFVYLFLPRKAKNFDFILFSNLILLVGSLLTIVPQITTQKYVAEAWRPSTRTLDRIVGVVRNKIENDQLTGVNLAVLGSPDPNRYGWKYRSLLELKGVNLMSKYEYFTNNYLFVISKATDDQLRKDPSPEMERFRREKLIGEWATPEHEWFVYLYSF